MIGLTVTFTGFLAGVYYFFRRLDFDNTRDELNRRSLRFKILTEFISDYKTAANELLMSDLSDEIQIKKELQRLDDLYEGVEVYLELNDKFLKLSKHDLAHITGVHAVISRNPQNYQISKMALEDRGKIRDEVAAAVRRARLAIFRNLE